MRIVAGPTHVADDRWIVGLNRPDDGVVAAAARPASEAFWSIGAAIHRAIGQQQPLQATTARDRDILAAWIEGYGIADVIVHHADRYPAGVMLAVEAVLAAAGARLWVVVDAAIHPLVVQEVADVAPVDAVAWEDFATRWAPVAAIPATAPTGAASRLDPVPAWATQHARLVRAAARRMDLPYLEGFCVAAGWSRARRPDKRVTCREVRRLLERYVDPECFASAVRGLAVGLHEVGWQVTLDLDRLARTATGAPLERLGDVARLAAVRRFRDPLVAAATGLASLDLSRDEITGLEVGDVAADGSRVDLWHDVVAVPAVLAPVLRAQRALRLRGGATASDRFLVDGRQPLSARRFATIVLAAVDEAGASIPKVELDERPAADERWLLARGVALGWISRLDRRSVGPAGMTGAAFLARVVGELRRPDAIEGRDGCRCAADHAVPDAPAPGTWPPVPHHAPPPADHPWRANAFRQREVA